MVFHLVVLFQLILSSTAATASDVRPGCQAKCGNITMPYPFGTGDGCYLQGFRMTCNDSYDPPKLFMGTGNVEVSNLSLASVQMNGWIARDCYNEVNPTKHVWTDLRGTPYTFSYTGNKFTAVGCDTVALIYRAGAVNDYVSGCISLCQNDGSIVNGSCSGTGCCQTAIPKGLKRFDTLLGSLTNHSSTSNFSPCSYAFLVDQEQFTFTQSEFYDLRGRNRVPVVLDWAVGNKTCGEAKRAAGFVCGNNSNCVDSTNGPGYRCRCQEGYQGNPYLADGCQDINECEDANNTPCVKICTNTPGSYFCSCPRGTQGDGKKDGNGCTAENKAYPLVQVVLGSGFGFLFVIISGSWLYWAFKKRRLITLREKFFKQNGGLLLQQQISSRDGAPETARIFSAEELKRATNNYSGSQVLGEGGYGTVYKGILPDKRVVAIKKSKIVDESQIEQFINEVIILSQVIHKNVVRILGCCLETPVPMLVYEFVSNGTLSHHIHDEGHVASLSWDSRLRIASETAGALAYLHFATIRPIFHRDVKSTNILLDEKYTAKVSDFGASRLIPMNKAHITTLVQGTLGYLDPEYFHTGQLTEKSDVYSFGVVLVELLTGEKPLSSSRSEEVRNLAIYFLISMENNKLVDILEPRVLNEGNGEQLQEFAELAQRCLRLKGDERPTMKEVAEDLERLRRFERFFSIQQDDIEDQSGRLSNGDSSIYYTSTANRSAHLDQHIIVESLNVER